MALKEKINTEKILSIVGGVSDMLENIEPVYEFANPEEVFQLLEQAWNLGEKAWMVQADCLRIINDQSKYGAKAIESVAKEIGISRSYAFDLYNISKHLLTKDEELRKLRNLSVGHFVNVIRSIKKIENPFALLKKASDEGWSATDINKIIKGEKVEKAFTTEHYKLTSTSVANKEWAATNRISDKAYVYTDRNGDKFLELKIYEN